MDIKRKHPLDTSSFTPGSKRLRPSLLDSGDEVEESTSRAPRPILDPKYGQRGAFPELGTEEDHALFYGPASDGLEYLRMVRSEAATVPMVLTAPAPQTDSRAAHANDLGGSYGDGAYTAAPALFEHGGRIDVDDDDVDPQDAYYASLVARFAKLSTSLQTPPNTAIGSASTRNAAQDLNSGSNSKWRSLLNRGPSMALLGLLSHECVLQGLQMMVTRLTVDHLIKTPSLGLWAWGLMARCRDAGQMSSEEIGILRDLGKKAIGLLRGMQAGLQQEYPDEDDSEDERETSASKTGVDTSQENRRGGVSPQNSVGSERMSIIHQLEQAKAQVRARLQFDSNLPALEVSESHTSRAASPPSLPPTQVPTSQEEEIPEKSGDLMIRVRATLDVIITIVGEAYGQRDLLEGRLVWGE